MALLIPQASEALCRRLSPEPSFPSLGKENLGGDQGRGQGENQSPPAFWVALWEPLS